MLLQLKLEQINIDKDSQRLKTQTINDIIQQLKAWTTHEYKMQKEYYQTH